ncbi:hypothetical protein ACPCG0_01060 [Propionibacteriaceae bacterium Y1923]
MDLGALILTSTVLLGRRFGHYLMVAIVPAVLTGALVAGAVLLGEVNPLLGWVAAVVVVVLRTLLALAGAALTMGLAEGGLLGEERTFAQAAQRTRGTLRRVGWVQVAIALVWALPLFGWVRASQWPDVRFGDVVVEVTLFGLCAPLVLLVWLSRFMFVVPVAALEHDRRGLQVYRRSWQTSSGHGQRLAGHVGVWGVALTVVVLVCAPLAQRWLGDVVPGHNLLGVVVSQTAVALVLSVLGALWQVFTLVTWADVGRRG